MSTRTDAKPAALPVLAENIPAELKEYDQWVVWKADKVLRNARTGGPSYSADGVWGSGRFKGQPRPEGFARATWSSFHEALAAHQGDPDKYPGVGFVCDEADPFTVFDLDDCRDPITGQIEPGAAERVSQLNTYAEVSPSKTGLRIIAKGKLPPRGRRKGNIEVYDAKHFLSITGHHLAGTPATINDRQTVILQIHGEVFGKQDERELKPARGRNGYVPADKQILDVLPILYENSWPKIKRLLNGDSTLWEGDGKLYDSRSEADFGLINYFAYLTPDADQIDRLMRTTKLVREKWNDPRGSKPWLRDSIDNALDRRTDWFEWQHTDQQRAAAIEEVASTSPTAGTTKQETFAKIGKALKRRKGNKIPRVIDVLQRGPGGPFELICDHEGEHVPVPLGTADQVLLPSRVQSAVASVLHIVPRNRTKAGWYSIACWIVESARVVEVGSDVDETLSWVSDFIMENEILEGKRESPEDIKRAIGMWHKSLREFKGFLTPENVLYVSAPSLCKYVCESWGARTSHKEVALRLSRAGFESTRLQVKLNRESRDKCQSSDDPTEVTPAGVCCRRFWWRSWP